MKKSTKILLILFIISLVPAIFFGRYFFGGIKAIEGGFIISYDTYSILGAVFVSISLVLGVILYIFFLRAITLSKTLFFVTLPLTALYGFGIYFLASSQSADGQLATNVRLLLNLSTENNYNSILWAVLLTALYLLLLLFAYTLACKPVGKVERVVARLSDGRVREEEIDIGGGKKFQGLEDSLNKINHTYREKDRVLRKTRLEKQKFIPKQFFKFFGKSAINDLEMGKGVSKKAYLMRCHLSLLDKEQAITVQEGFTFFSSYMKTVTPLVRRYDGFIERYMGEGIIAVFSSAKNALSCAHALEKAVEIKAKTSAYAGIEVNISLFCQDVTFALGKDQSKGPRIINDIMPFADRLSRINDYFKTKVIFTKQVLDEMPIGEKMFYRYIGDILEDGRSIAVFESFAVYRKDKREVLERMKNVFELGVRYYNESEYDKAQENFSKVLRFLPSDKVSYIYFNKSEEKANKGKLH